MVSEYNRCKDINVALPVHWIWQRRSERGQHGVTAEHLSSFRALPQQLSVEAQLPRAVCLRIELCVKDTAPSNTLPARLDGWHLPFGGGVSCRSGPGGSRKGEREETQRPLPDVNPFLSA